MVSVSELNTADPQKWRDAADDAIATAKQCEGISSYARDEVASTLKQCWVGDTGSAARTKFVKHADDYDAAAVSLRAMAKAYDDLADDIDDARRLLRSALDYASTHELKVDDSGRVQLAKAVAVPAGSTEHLEPVKHAQGIIDDALSKATRADVEASRALRTVEGLTAITDPKLAKEALNPNSPLAIALRLSGGTDGLHPINVSPSQLAAVDRAARETGMSKKLLLAILWQEQQWYQNHNPSLRGPLTSFGRFFDWSLQQTLKPDKSLGITHMKLETAREVIKSNPDAFTLSDGKYLGDLNDSQLTKYIEENPNEDVRLSAYHLKGLKENPYGADSDKDLFTLYAADTPDVREKNEQYGDESDQRGGDIKVRGKNWDKVEPHLDDAMAWDSLSDEERSKAIKQLESETPGGHHVSIETIYSAGGPTTGTGTGEPEPGTPSPSPNPPPTPPGN
ncbi:hypothetical protein OG883_00545 [Streptomyces sp. NBC_01142]|uniref:hypothetical protein n=1 Tax=Streptomyces sp. NBC_01142 TaxID=2975865 RepID=UPI002258E4B2|nr:hypothetical protein [Streptomyces sp. NBC_01142]MCX4818419.1 hypothetical protein [Streptomyces sp. NBC_01142]